MPANEKSDPLGRILSYLVAISTIIGIPAGLYGYFSSQHDKRVEKTFEFYDKFRSDDIQNDLSLLISRWNDKAPEIRHLVLNKERVQLERLVRDIVEEDGGLAAMENVISFFDELMACVENSLCDNNTAYALFKDSAYKFSGTYEPYIIYIRKEFNNEVYGTGLFQIQSLEKKLSVF